MINRDILPYRPCVGICLFNAIGQVFVGERIDTPGAWQMPQGGIDENELIEDTALRELREEIGTDKAELLKIAAETICYDLPEHLVTSLWNGKYRGQEQHWVAMRFTGCSEDIDLNAHSPAEFSSWQWVELHKTLDLIVPFKRKVYEFVIDQFSDITD
ncbi:MAG: RNA pyrophosphohydrolase [Alphaproteobacteria bacterium]|nr:RNA pyrophosphohydrolase [Alphaproteobacteria bacterium]